MPTQNVNVTDKIANFVHRQVENGTFKNVSEVHRAALVEMERKEEERRDALEWLRKEAQVGIDQIEAGECTTFNGIEELDEWMEGVLEEVIAKGKSNSAGDVNLDAEPVS